jgi:hypothetical protein
LKEVTSVLQEVSTAGAPVKARFAEIVTAFNALRDAWLVFQVATEKPVFAVFVDAMNLVSTLLPRLIPIVEAVAGGIQGALATLGKGTGSLRSSTSSKTRAPKQQSP